VIKKLSTKSFHKTQGIETWDWNDWVLRVYTLGATQSFWWQWI